MKKILLYNPREKTRVRVPHVPFSLLTVASALKVRYEVIIVDGRITADPEAVIEKHLADCLFFGITCMSGTPIIDALKIAQFVRAKNSSIPLVWGGFHPTLVPEATISHRLVDIVIIGQGEETAVELAEALNNGLSLSSVRGIAFKNKGKPCFNEARQIKDINEFPAIDYGMLPLQRYLKRDAAERTLDYLSSRGCPYKCAFCCINKMYARGYFAYPAARVVNEIECLVRHHSVTGIRFMDDNFFANRARVGEICDGLLSKNIDVKWWAMCRADELVRFDDAFWGKLKKAGLSILNIGVESGSQKVLDRISKGITVAMTLDAAALCRTHNVEAQFSFMIGFPFESRQDWDATMDSISRINRINPFIDIGLFIYTPNPGTPLYEESTASGARGYATLEEWGARSDYFHGNAPWFSKQQKQTMETLSYLVQFAFGRTLRRKLKPLQRFLHLLLSFDARLRWKLRLFSFPLEWKIIRYLSGADF
jgi:radical SAM superfamily enzyme YgiQ (UPF0313 family)